VLGAVIAVAAAGLALPAAATAARYVGCARPAPPHGMTVHGWREQALQDARVADMPLHCTRHTAAAAWLTTGDPLVSMQRELGHRSISSTEEHYAHLEVHFMRDAVGEPR
jgi:integrase